MGIVAEYLGVDPFHGAEAEFANFQPTTQLYQAVMNWISYKFIEKIYRESILPQ